MSSDTEKDFIEGGFKHYVEANEAMWDFSTIVGEQVGEALRSFEDWKSLKPDATTLTQNWGGDPKRGWWVYAVQKGQLNGTEVLLELGVWWKARGAKPPCILYANVGGLPKTFDYEPADKSVKAAVIDRKTRLYVEPGEWGRFGDQLETILTELNTLMETVKPGS